jgi:hypothetical protein
MSSSGAAQLALDIPAPLVNDGRCFTREFAASIGLAGARLASALAAGAIREVVHNVFVDARTPDDPATWLAALRLAVPPGAVVAGRSAAWVHGIDVQPLDAHRPRRAPRVVECIAPLGRQPRRRPGVSCRAAPLYDDVDDFGGVRCTAPLRTALDLLCRPPRHLALAAADAMAHAGFFTAAELNERVARSELRPGLRHARRLAELCEPATESFAESWTRLRVVDARLPRPEVQIPLGPPGDEEYRIDLGYPDRRIGVEFDGLQFHSAVADRRHDEARRRRIRDVYGWTLLVVGRREILGRSSDFELALADLLGCEPRLRRRSW